MRTNSLFFIFIVLVGFIMVAPVAGEAADYPFTGLIVDASGFGVLPAMSPKINDANGDEVYGTMDIGYRIVEELGIVRYANSLQEALALGIAGEHPMVIHAVDGARDPWQSSVVVDPYDAVRIKQADSAHDFLKDLRVVFVI